MKNSNTTISTDTVAKKLVAAAYTPMHSDGSLHTELVPKYQHFLIRNKVSGVFTNGSTADFTSLSAAERMQITQAWADCKTEALYVINHVGDLNINTAKELAAHSVGKADAIAVIPPFYFHLNSVDLLVDYCQQIAKSAPELPLYYYHIPSLSKANFKMIDFIKKVSKVIPSFAGIKFSCNDINDFKLTKDFENCKYDILFGCDDMLHTSLSFNTNGWVGSTYNQLAPLYNKIISLTKEGNNSEASKLQEKSVKFIQLLDNNGGFTGVGKGFMKALGMDMGPSRFPHKTISDQELEKLKQLIKDEGIQDYLSN